MTLTHATNAIHVTNGTNVVNIMNETSNVSITRIMSPTLDRFLRPWPISTDRLIDGLPGRLLQYLTRNRNYACSHGCVNVAC